MVSRQRLARRLGGYAKQIKLARRISFGTGGRCPQDIHMVYFYRERPNIQAWVSVSVRRERRKKYAELLDRFCPYKVMISIADYSIHQREFNERIDAWSQSYEGKDAMAKGERIRITNDFDTITIHFENKEMALTFKLGVQ
jgi:hypothetical protein